MKAYLVNKYKRPMQAGEAPEPTVGPRDVLVEIRAAGVNLLDAKIRDGEFKAFLPYKAPFILGHDVAGVVSRIGSGVTRVSVGDEVYARVRDGRMGTFAERIAVHEDDLAIKPASLSMAEAASVLASQTGDRPAKPRGFLKRGAMVTGIAGPPAPAFARQLDRRLLLLPVMALLSFQTRRAARRHGVRYSFLFMRASGIQLDE